MVVERSLERRGLSSLEPLKSIGELKLLEVLSLRIIYMMVAATFEFVEELNFFSKGVVEVRSLCFVRG